MKVGIIGVGYVGTSCAKAMMLRGSCHEIVLIDLPKRNQHTQGVCNDLSHGSALCPVTRLTAGEYTDLQDALLVVITAGINEKEGVAIDRNDPWGRQRLLSPNADIYRDIVPRILEQTETAPIIVVTDPPDTLADVAREIVIEHNKSNSVISAGTFLDSLRFRIQIAEQVGCAPNSVDAYVIGEHGKTQVYEWSSARIGGIPVVELIDKDKYSDVADFQRVVQSKVIDANIDIIDATDASQHGIGIVTARFVEAILRDERLVAPVGTWRKDFGVTLSLPSIIGNTGVQVLKRPNPVTDEEMDEKAHLCKGAAYLAEALERVRNGEEFKTPPSLTWDAWSERLRL